MSGFCLAFGPARVGEFGDVGEYAGDVGEYAGDVGEYAGDVGEYAGLIDETISFGSCGCAHAGGRCPHP